MQHLTVGELAFELSRKHDRRIPTWKIRRVINSVAPDCPRFAGVRQIPASMIPKVEEQLVVEGWLPADAVVGVQV